ncbi:MAG: PBP1A family penicillin-binding protein [Acidobacteriia bacterium]|nr:PBP1A family penicillin-binding protein [Terriglobia bacterium]
MRKGTGGTVKRSRWLFFLKLTAVLVSIPAIVVAAFLIHYYYVFDRWIDQKLGKGYEVAETEIYSAPRTIYPGKPISLPDFLTRLRRLGYVDRSTSGDSKLSTFQLGKTNHLLVRNDSSLPEDADRAVDIDWAGNRVRNIVEMSSGQNLEHFALKPELISNIIDKSREKRRYAAYRDFPKVLVDAVLASEDRRFFSHKGVDPIRILKAAIIDIRAGENVQGASTLTQQFVKQYFLTPERTWRRKLTDAYMAILLEQRLSKEEIFELYANEIYLGQRGSFSIVGFGEAAGAFFDKAVANLTLSEAATLVGVIPAPNRYTPLRYPERAKQRRDLVLDRMAEYEMITPRQRDEAKAQPLGVKPSNIMNYSDAPYFVDYLQDILGEQLGDVALGRTQYKIHTTLDMDLQQVAFESVRDEMVTLDEYFAKGKRGIPPGTVQASLIAVDPRTGHVLAMVGGRDYGVSQFNRITQSKRQPGSIFKPFVYTAALETANYSSTPLTPAATVLDEPTQFEFENLVYEPKNFKDEYLGQVTMRQAITKSLNVATIKFAEKVGYTKIADLAHRLGLNEAIKPYPAMAIGAFEVTPLEMVRAYTAFANDGMLSELMPLSRVLDEKGSPVFQPENKTRRALTPQVAFMLTSLLQSVINEGTGAGARTAGFTLPAAGKTGTSRDGWFAGYTPDLLCIVWVGFDDNRELNLPGSQSALPIWASFMKRAVALKPLTGEEFPVPEGITQVEIDPTTGLLATDRCLTRQMEYFIKGSEPVIPCYGNSYEQMMNGIPRSIYSSPTKGAPSGADKNIPPSPPIKKSPR